jgi:hypothetical protein
MPEGPGCGLTPVPDFSPSSASVASWRVPDIEATVRELRGRGVRFLGGDDKDELGIWSDPSGAGKVAWFSDPEGNTLSLSWATDPAEQAATGVALAEIDHPPSGHRP